MEKFLRNACKQSLYLFAKIRMGTQVMLGTIGLFPLQLSSPSCLNTTFCHAFLHFWPQQTTSLVSSQNMALTCVFFYLNRLRLVIVSKDTPVFSAFLDASKAFDRTIHNLLFAKLIKRNVPMCIVRLLLSWYRQQTMQVKWGATTNCTHPIYCNQWGKARGSSELILICCLP